MARKWWTLVAVCVATFMLLLDITVVNVALPDIQKDLNASLSSLQWVVDAYSLTLAAFLLTAGSFADRMGRRRVFTAGFAIFTFASFLCGISGNATLLNLARGLQGIGGAAMFATSLALIAQEFQGRERGTAIGAWGATIGGAVAVGPLVGGALTEAFGWEWIFFVNVPIGIGAIFLTTTKLANLKAPDPEAARLARPGDLLAWPVRAHLRADPRQPRGLVEPPDRRHADGVGGLARRVRGHRAPARQRDARPLAVPKARLRRCVGGRVDALRLDVRDVPVPDAVHTGRARIRAARGGREVPAADAALLLRRPRRRQALGPDTGAGLARRGPRAGRRGAASDARGRSRRRLDDPPGGLHPRRSRGGNGESRGSPRRRSGSSRR